MSWFKRMPSPKVKDETKRSSTPSGMFEKCDGCSAAHLARDLEDAQRTCPSCGHHMRIRARERLALFADPESLEETAADLASADPLRFQDQKPYLERVASAAEKAGEDEAFVLATARLEGRAIVTGAFEFEFMGGSMGSVVGEKIARGFELAAERRWPIVLFSASGGARMQEGILSLMQMAKTAVAIERFREARRPFVSVLTDPTTGGVAASVALLGDVIIAEPGALIGFAGPRVIEQTIRQKLPEGFQRAEFLLEKGVIDRIVPRRELRGLIASLLAMMVD